MDEIRKGRLISIDGNFNETIQLAAEIYNRGGVFVYPTDTIFGIGGDPFNKETVKKINQIKGRDESKRFILLADNLDRLFEYAHVVLDKHFDFLHAIWPNPVSVVLNLKPSAVKLLGTPTAAFRIPHHRFCRNLISEIKKPLISTSVNRSGESPLNEVDPINYEFGPELDGIFYSIHQPLGLASTILDLTGNAPVLIREGSVKFRDLMEVFP